MSLILHIEDAWIRGAFCYILCKVIPTRSTLCLFYVFKRIQICACMKTKKNKENSSNLNFRRTETKTKQIWTFYASFSQEIKRKQTKYECIFFKIISLLPLGLIHKRNSGSHLREPDISWSLKYCYHVRPNRHENSLDEMR